MEGRVKQTTEKAQSPNPHPSAFRRARSVCVARILLASSTMSVENGSHFVNSLENARDSANICTNEKVLRSAGPRDRWSRNLLSQLCYA